MHDKVYICWLRVHKFKLLRIGLFRIAYVFRCESCHLQKHVSIDKFWRGAYGH